MCSIPDIPARFRLRFSIDEFRAAPPRPTAVDGMRSLLLLEEELVAASGETSTPSRMLGSPTPVYHGFEFVEFAVDEYAAAACRHV